MFYPIIKLNPISQKTVVKIRLAKRANLLGWFLGSFESAVSTALLLFIPKAEVATIAEWELILNRAGIPFGSNDVIKLTICPKHRAKYTTMYQVKVMNQTNADYC